MAFVDAGFLQAEGARSLQLQGRPNMNAAGCVGVLRTFAEREQCSLLRVYWYDAEFEPGTELYANQKRYFDALASTPGIQLRLGHIKQFVPAWHAAVKYAIRACNWDPAVFEQRFTFHPEREQKGVDTLIVLDMVRLAQRRAYDTAVLVAGDRDLADAVRVVQDEGRRVILAHPNGGPVASELRQLADEVCQLTYEELTQMVRPRPS